MTDEMGHPARRRSKSKPLVTKATKPRPTVGAIPATVKLSVPEAASQQVQLQVPAPQQDLQPTPHAGPLAGSLQDERDGQLLHRPGAAGVRLGPVGRAPLDLTDSEWDSLFCLAVRHHFEQEQVWVPSVLRTMPLLEGINDRTGRRCRIYIRPHKHILMVEDLS